MLSRQSGQAIFEFAVISAIVVVAAALFFRASVQSLPAQFSSSVQSAIACMSDYTKQGGCP